MKIDAYNFTIYDVENVQVDLMVELANSDEVVADMESVEKIDLAALQLLVSTKRSCAEEKKAFKVTNLCDEVSSAIRMSGLEAELGV
jgi:ABC-type transporter Mla MlaB component